MNGIEKEEMAVLPTTMLCRIMPAIIKTKNKMFNLMRSTKQVSAVFSQKLIVMEKINRYFIKTQHLLRSEDDG